MINAICMPLQAFSQPWQSRAEMCTFRAQNRPEKYLSKAGLNSQVRFYLSERLKPRRNIADKICRSIVKQAKLPRTPCQRRQKIPALHSRIKCQQSASQRPAPQPPAPESLCNAACTAWHCQQSSCTCWHTCQKQQYKQGKPRADLQTASLTP